MSKKENERLVPNLRFKGFTDDWIQRQLSDLATHFDYGLNAAAKEFDGENKYLRITDIDDETRTFNLDNLRSPSGNLSGKEEYLIRKEDIVFARTGASVGKSYLHKEKIKDVYFAGFLIRIRSKNGTDPKFIFYNTLTNEYKKFVKITSARSGQPGINANEYKSYKLYTPHYNEQKRIGNMLNKIDKIITLEQKKYELLISFKKYIIQNIFNNNNLTSLKEVATITTGKLNANAMDPDGIYDFYTSGINTYTINEYAFEGPAITIAGNGATVGFMHMANGKFNAYQRTYVLQNFKINREYLFYNIQKELPRKIHEESRTGSIPYIVMDMLEELPIYLDDVKIMNTIGTKLELIDKIIKNSFLRIEKIKEIKKNLLDNLFV